MCMLLVIGLIIFILQVHLLNVKPYILYSLANPLRGMYPKKLQPGCKGESVVFSFAAFALQC